MNIKTLTLEDLALMIDLDYEITGENHKTFFETYIGMFDELTFGAFEDGKLLGFLLASIRQIAFGQPEKIAYLEMIEVGPSEQRKGIGFTLMREFEKRLKKMEIKRVITIVNWKETNLLSYFKSQGFQMGEMVQIEKVIT
ncbi:MAG: GNAT family N-acetyltransferase [Candidatus Hodarchaeales archaeon]|jgi:predicted N-acetyltransferase YhbS